MVERRVTVQNSHGIHARPAAEIVKAAARFSSHLTLARDATVIGGEAQDALEVNGKSIMGVMMLAAEKGAELIVRADGDDAEAAVDALAALIASQFGET
jgi:phosphocarrier protein HPr